jgi:hypothetical protein
LFGGLLCSLAHSDRSLGVVPVELAPSIPQSDGIQLRDGKRPQAALGATDPPVGYGAGWQPAAGWQSVWNAPGKGLTDSRRRGQSESLRYIRIQT